MIQLETKLNEEISKVNTLQTKLNDEVLKVEKINSELISLKK